MRDLISNNQLVLIGTVTLSGVTPGATSLVDLRGFDGATIYLATDTVTDAGTASGFTFTLQHADVTTGTSFADVATADTVGGSISLTVTADADDNKLVGGIGYIGSKRYLRMNGVGTTNTDATVKVYALLGEPHRGPATAIGTSVAST